MNEQSEYNQATIFILNKGSSMSIHSLALSQTIPETVIYLFSERYNIETAYDSLLKELSKQKSILKDLASLDFRFIRKNKKDPEIECLGLRYKPFWRFTAQREVDYLCKDTYSIPTIDKFAQKIQIIADNLPQALTYQVNNSKIELPIIEHCHKKIKFEYKSEIIVEKETRSIDFYLNKGYSMQKKRGENSDTPIENTYNPEITKTSLLEKTKNALSEAIDADEIINDEITCHELGFYLLPVFLFQYTSFEPSKEDKGTYTAQTQFIEIDGLTGEILNNTKNKLSNILSNEQFRNFVIETAAEIAGAIIPGSGPVIKYVAQR